MEVRREQIQFYAERASRGDRTAEERAIVEMYSLISFIARSYRIPGNDEGDNTAIALAAATLALRSYDPARGPATPYVSQVIRNALLKAKDKDLRRASHEAPDSESVERTAGGEKQTPIDVAQIRRLWPFLTHAEKRGAMAVMTESQYAEAGAVEGITKQAIEKAWRNVKRMLDEGPGDRPPAAASPLDWHLEPVLARLAG